jgi:hypothetical protein
MGMSGDGVDSSLLNLLQATVTDILEFDTKRVAVPLAVRLNVVRGWFLKKQHAGVSLRNTKPGAVLTVGFDLAFRQ